MKKTKFIVQSAVIAALYAALTLVSSAFGMSSGAIQVRISEALAVLPFFTAAAIPGLFLGCIISNTITGCMLIDIIFGSIATLIGAIGAYLLRGKKWLVPLPTIISNAIIVPLVLAYAYKVEQSIPFLMLTVGIGELISAGVLGMILLLALEKHKDILKIN
ncbi:MAG: QueT transporter family protein [Clostridia bacterium]|nr:QueT transporter family protein [Clostridia bacterium]